MSNTTQKLNLHTICCIMSRLRANFESSIYVGSLKVFPRVCFKFSTGLWMFSSDILEEFPLKSVVPLSWLLLQFLITWRTLLSVLPLQFTLEPLSWTSLQFTIGHKTFFSSPVLCLGRISLGFEPEEEVFGWLLVCSRLAVSNNVLLWFLLIMFSRFIGEKLIVLECFLRRRRRLLSCCRSSRSELASN